MNLVLFKLSPIGDTVMFLPVVQTLRRIHPQWQITVLTTPAAQELYHGTLPHESIWVVERAELQRCWQRPRRLFQWWRRVRQLRPDATLLSFDQSSVARFLAAGSGASVRIGGAGSTVRWQGGLTHTIAKTASQTIAEWEWNMAAVMMRALGADWPTALTAPVLPVTIPSENRPRRRVLIHAGASRSYQRWLPERFAELANKLARDCEVLWVERPEIAVATPSVARGVSPSGLVKFLELVTSSDLFVGNHSGAFHLAAAAGVPCVVVSGPSPFFCDPPWHSRNQTILRAKSLACLPCDQLTVSAEICRNWGQPMACMHYWDTAAVEAACRERLNQAPTA